MDDFIKTLRFHRKLIMLAVGGSAMPITGYLLSMAPPTSNGIVTMTSIAEMVAIFMAYLYLRGVIKANGRLVLTVGALSFFVLMFIYMYSFNSLTFKIPQASEGVVEVRSVRGLQCNSEVIQLNIYKDDCPNLGIREIANYDHNADQIWTKGSIDKATLILEVIWVLLFSCIAFIFSGFAALLQPEVIDS